MEQAAKLLESYATTSSIEVRDGIRVLYIKQDRGGEVATIEIPIVCGVPFLEKTLAVCREGI